LNNSANATQTFEVWVADSDATVTIRMNDSRTTNTTIGQGLAGHSSGDYHYTAVELPDSARLHGRFTVAPSEENRSSIEEFPRNYAVVVVLYLDEHKIGWWGSANCGNEALLGLEVVSRSNSDAFSAFECR
jgi:hypothetical protein